MNKYINSRSVSNPRVFGLVAGVLALLSGYVAPAGGDVAPGSLPGAGHLAPTSGRILVKFHVDVDPTNARFLGKLSEGLGVSLGYLRSLSDDAHLLQARGLKDAAHFAHVVTQLNRRAEVVYAEADARMRHQ